MEFYNIFLLIFDFADFYNYFEKHSGDIDDIAFEYLDEQIELANTNDDFDLLNNCVNIKKLIDKYYEELFINSHIFVCVYIRSCILYNQVRHCIVRLYNLCMPQYQ